MNDLHRHKVLELAPKAACVAKARLVGMAEVLGRPYCTSAKKDGHYLCDQSSDYQRLRSCCVCAAACTC